MIAAAAVVGFLVLISLLRVGIIVLYDEDGLVLDAFFGPAIVKILPSDKTKQKSKIEKKEKAREGAAKAGKLEILKNQLPSIKKALSRLKRKLLIKELTIYYMAAGTDPASTALYFGAASAGYGLILPIIENNFKIKKRDLRAAVNFEMTEPYIYVKAKMSLAVWEIIYVAFGLLITMVKSQNMRAKIRKAV